MMRPSTLERRHADVVHRGNRRADDGYRRATGGAWSLSRPPSQGPSA